MDNLTHLHGQKRNRSAEMEWCCWPDCREPRCPASDAPPLCVGHLVSCATYIAEAMGKSLLDPERDQQAMTAAKRDAIQGEVVYYLRLGDQVKIGTTTNLPRRMASLYVDHDPEALLATESGGRAVEAERHGQFAAERVYANRELFRLSPRLAAHIDELRLD